MGNEYSSFLVHPIASDELSLNSLPLPIRVPSLDALNYGRALHLLFQPHCSCQDRSTPNVTPSMDALFQLLSNPAVALLILLLVVYSVYNRLTAVSNIPAGIPWIGKDPSKLFADTRANLASFSNVREWLEVGYKKVYSPLLWLSTLESRG